MAKRKKIASRRNRAKALFSKLRGDATRQQSRFRSAQLEPFEERTLFAVGPALVAILEPDGTVLAPNQTINIAPSQLTLRFDAALDPTTLATGGVSAIQFTRSVDTIFNNGNDVPIAPGYLALGDNPTDVVVRFTSTLPADKYQVSISGALKSTTHLSFNGGTSLTQGFTLQTGPQVVSIVPQPIVRDPGTGALSKADNGHEIDVYFNANDPLIHDDPSNPNSVTNPINFALIRTAGTTTEADDLSFHPSSITYDQATGMAKLFFDPAGPSPLDTPDLYRLQIGNNTPLALSPDTTAPGQSPTMLTVNHAPGSAFTVNNNPSDPNSAAIPTAPYFTQPQGAQSIDLTGTISGSPVSVIYPGGDDEPGQRDISTPTNPGPVPSLNPTQDHFLIGPDRSGQIPVIQYNFQSNYGYVLGQPVFNGITDAQKQRVREALTYWANYLGVEFEEVAVTPNSPYTTNAGWTFATGDVRSIATTIPAASAAVPAVEGTPIGPDTKTPLGGSAAVMSGSVNWGSSEPGGLFFVAAMNEIGHLLGLGNDFDAPPLTVMGVGQGGPTVGNSALVFPGDADIVYGQYLHPPTGNDVNVFDINVPTNGQVNFETFAERIPQVNNDIQQLSFTGATGGTFALTFAFNGTTQTTGGLAFNATAATVQNALSGLSSVGAGNVLVTGANGGPFTVTFQNNLAGKFVPLLTANSASLVNSTVVVSGMPSQLDTVISIYDANTHTLLARNDDYYGKDSFVQLQLTAGDYFVVVTSTGNTHFDPTIANSGFGGTTQGRYQLRVTFTPTPTAGIEDLHGVQLDGDADGSPGGLDNFWFRVSSQTIYVDKSNTQANPDGSLANPYPKLFQALNSAPPGSIVRVEGNGGADGNLATTNDNLSYNLGFDSVGGALSDSSPSDPASLKIPKGVTMMIDAGAIIKLRGANIDVGSSSVNDPRQGGALQVLGTPAGPVNEVQQVSLSGATAGTFTLGLAFNGVTSTTGALAFNASASTVQTALAGLANIGAGNVAVTGANGGPYTVTFQNVLGAQPLPVLSSTSTLTGGKVVLSLINEGGHIGTVYFTSYYDTTIGKDLSASKNNINPVATGNWGGIVFRQDSDLVYRAATNDYAPAGIFMNYVDNAQINYGGGQVVVNSQPSVYDPIHIISARPTISNNLITKNADAAMSADPNSFQESEFQGVNYDSDYSRVGPSIHGNTLTNNSINGMFVRIHTDPNTHQVLDPLTVSARFISTDIVYVIQENLLIQGTPGGYLIDSTGKLQDRQSARLTIDPGAVVKLSGARIETQIGAQFIAEGTAAKPIIFTSAFDDTYGAGGSFDTTNNNNLVAPFEGAWGGLFFGPLSIGSIDHALIQYGGGRTSIEGGFDNFDVIEIHQAQVRIANSTIQHNASGGGGNRNGRGTATQAIIYVIGAQPVILNNVIQNNNTTGTSNPNTAAISINVSALNSALVNDWGRSTGPIGIQGNFSANVGPLIRGNQLANNPINGMIVRGGQVTTDVVWDDTDIVHVLEDEVEVSNAHATSGTVRLQSTSTESLVVKLLGTTAGFTADGEALDITDRIGGSLQIVGLPNHPVVLTSLLDTTVGAGFTPTGTLQTDTANQKGVVIGNTSQFPNSGPILIDGANRDAHGSNTGGQNAGGWQYIQQVVNFAYTGSRNATAGASGILVIGAQPTLLGGASVAQQAINAAAAALATPPTVTFITGQAILSANFSQFKMIYIPSDAADVDGGITDADLALLAQRKSALQTYVNVTGGGLIALSESSAANPFGWLALPDQITSQRVGGGNLTQTAAFTALGLNLSNQQISAGTPWLNDFTGPPGFDHLQPWLVDQSNGDVVTLGAAPGSGGIGPRTTNAPLAGDWAGLTLDTLSNDTNVAIVNEVEQKFSAAGDTNSLTTTAQFIGTLAKDAKSGDDNSRLGFEIHGTINQAFSLQQAGSAGDVDVYSFQATAGSTVWFDIGNTSSSLDSVLELVDGSGAVIARSNDSLREQQNPLLLYAPLGTGDPSIVKPLAPALTASTPSATGAPSPFSNVDFNSTNPFDAGMRVVLPPGPAGAVSTYFIRVRANNGPSGTDSTVVNSPTLNQGLTKGAYQLQIRLQNDPQIAGSTVQSADIRYASTGIRVIGKPEHSPLLGDTASSSNPHSTLETAQDLGNLASTDRGEITVAGDLATATSVDWFKINVNYDLIQAINGYSNGLKTFGAMFSVNYADGLNRPDTTISIFDSHGNLIMIGRDSTTPDGQPRPGTGIDADNLSHGSFGALDPTIGTVQLPAGGPLITLADGTTVGQRTYYIAVSSSAVLPAVLDATFVAGPTAANPGAAAPTNPLVRLEPIDSTGRVVDDRIGSPGFNTAQPSQQIFPGSNANAAGVQQLNLSADPLHLGDVVMFVNTPFELYTVNPLTGAVETNVTNGVKDTTTPSTTGEVGNGTVLPNGPSDGAQNAEYFDLAMRDDGRLVSITQNFTSTVNADLNGMFNEINPADGTLLYSTPIGLHLWTVDPTTPINPASGNRPSNWNFVQGTGEDTGIAFQALAFGNSLTGTKVSPSATGDFGFRELLAVGSRPNFSPAGTGITESRNLIFELNPEFNGTAWGSGLGYETDASNGTFTTFQPLTGSNPDTNPIPAKSGTDLIPVGHINTGATIIAVPATDPTNSANNIISNQTKITVFGKGNVANVFTFFSGPQLTIPAGAVFTDGMTFTLDSLTTSTTYQFSLRDGSGGPVGGNTPVKFSPSDTPAQIAADIAQAVNGVDPLITASAGGNRVSFLGAKDTSSFAGLPVTAPSAASYVAPANAINFGDGDTAPIIASKIANAITSKQITLVTKVTADPMANPPIRGIPRSLVTATASGNDVVLGTDIITDVPLLAPLVTGPLVADQASNVTGIALLPSQLNPAQDLLVNPVYQPPDMFAVSATGGFYSVTQPNQGFVTTTNGTIFNSFFGNDLATSTLIKIIKDSNGNPIQFTGLSAGPPDVEGGKYIQTMFATDVSGNIYCLDRSGNLLPYFLNGATSISTGLTDLQGVTFSPADYNLWHATTTGASGPGHGETPSPDLVNGRSLNDGSGGTSFYFGLDDPNSIDAIYQQQPGAGGYKPGGGAFDAFVPIGSPISTRVEGHEELLNTYNVPGGAYGSLTSGAFSLAGYTASDKPTLYFDYSLDTQEANEVNGSGMLDSFRVFASTDGATWTELATNDLTKSVLFGTDAELPTYQSDSGGVYQGDKSNQQVQPLFNQTPSTTLFNPLLPTPAQNANTVDWRQARIDLGDFAGQSNIKLRFDFSSAGGMGTGLTTLNGSYLAGISGLQVQTSDSKSFTLSNTQVIGKNPDNSSISATTNSSFTFTSGLTLLAPVGAGGAIQPGETFTVNGSTVGTGKTYEFVKNPSLIPANGILADGNFAVLISDSSTAEDVAAAIGAAMGGTPDFDLLVPGGGSAIASGESFSVNGKLYQFTKTGSFTAGFVPVKISNSMTAADVAAAIGAALGGGPNFGFTVPAGGGLSIPNGEKFFVNSQVYEFTRTGNLPVGDINSPVLINNGMTANDVARAIANALSIYPVAGVTPTVSGADVKLAGASSAVALGANLILDGVQSPAPGVTPVIAGADVKLVGATAVTAGPSLVFHHVVSNPTTAVTPLVVGARVQLLGAASATAGPRIVVEGTPMQAPLLQTPANAGAAIPNGENFTVSSSGSSTTFEFTTSAGSIQTTGTLKGLLADGNVPIVIDITMSSNTVATQIMNAMTANPMLGVTPVLVGNHVQLLGATSVVQNQASSLGLLVPAGAGNTIQPGETFTINGTNTYEFVKDASLVPGDGILPDGNFAVLISNNSSASDVAAAIGAALGGPGVFSFIVPAAGAVGISNGETFTVNGVIFEFTRFGVIIPPADTNVLVTIDNSMSAQQVAFQIFEALTFTHPVYGVTATLSGTEVKLSGAASAAVGGSLTLNEVIPNPISGVTPMIVGTSVQLQGATTATSGPTITVSGAAIGAAAQLVLQGATAPALGRSDVPYTLNMTAAQVATQVAAAMDRVFSVSSPILVPPLDQTAPNFSGSQINAGETFTVNGKAVFEFTKTPGAITVTLGVPLLANGHVGVLINNNMTAAQVSAQIKSVFDAIKLLPANLNTIPGIDAVILGGGASVELLGAASITQSAGHAVALFGSTAKADDPKTFTSSKVDGNLIHVIGQSIVGTDPTHSGPLPFQKQMPGDQFSLFASAADGSKASARGQGNSHEGVFIDDVVVGFAGRGEMVTNSAVTDQTVPPTPLPAPAGTIGVLGTPVTGLPIVPIEQLKADAVSPLIPPLSGFHTFMTLPSDPDFTDPAKIFTGSYELDIRRATSYAVSTSALLPFITLTDTFDINDRLAAGITLLSVPASQIAAGSSFAVLTEGAIGTNFAGVPIVPGVTIFQFVRPDETLPPGNTNIPVVIHNDDDAAKVASEIRDAINMASSTNNFTVKAGLGTLGNLLTGNRVNLFGALDVLVANGPLSKIVYDDYGDATPVADQGQTIIQGNRISNTLQSGIAISPVTGGKDALGNATTGVPGRTGSPTILSLAPDGTTIVPGVAVTNNLIVHGGTVGISFTGSATTADGIAHIIPFGRIINNTIVGSTFGIQVANNASPTILNNVIAQMTSAAIAIDQSSSTTIVGGNIYQSNAQNLSALGLVTLESAAIALTPSQPLFVNSSKNNYYLQEGSLAIDSSINSLPERDALHALNSLGIPDSSIQAPDYDLQGQLRVADPLTQLTGVGQNVFKDRGAIERADFLGPIATLANPVDNDAAGLDHNSAPNAVQLIGQVVNSFNIQLSDAGIGVDDSTVDISKFSVKFNGVELARGTGFTLSYDSTNKLAKLISPTGIWANGTYVITLDNSITDLANNSLQANQPPITQFTIQLSATAASKFQNTNKFDVFPDGVITVHDLLIVINDLISGTVESINNTGGFPLGPGGVIPANATVNAPPNDTYPDVNGNGAISASDALLLINQLNNPAPPAALPPASTMVATPSAAMSANSVTSASMVASPSSVVATSAAVVPSVAAGTSVAAPVPMASALAASSAASPTTSSAAVAAPAAANLSAQSQSSSSQAAATSASPMLVSALATTYASSSWDDSTSDLDGILTDLTTDLQRRRVAS